jgi:hypothetical protein
MKISFPVVFTTTYQLKALVMGFLMVYIAFVFLRLFGFSDPSKMMNDSTELFSTQDTMCVFSGGKRCL